MIGLVAIAGSSSAHTLSSQPSASCALASSAALTFMSVCSAEPAYIAWGNDLTSLFNDGYISILGNKYRQALGAPYTRLFEETWEEYRPIVEATLRGESHSFVDRPVALVGVQALASAHRRHPDLVLLDLGMPEMDGFEVARRLRAQLAGGSPVHIVALSGWGQESDRQKTKAALFDGHLVKPAARAELQAVLSEVSRLQGH